MRGVTSCREGQLQWVAELMTLAQEGTEARERARPKEPKTIDTG